MNEVFDTPNINYSDLESQEIFNRYAKYKDELENRMKEWESADKLTGLKTTI